MTLEEVSVYAVSIFETTHPNEKDRADILFEFLLEEVGLTPESIVEVIRGKAMQVHGLMLKEDWITRFGVWLFINHLCERKYDDLGD